MGPIFHTSSLEEQFGPVNKSPCRHEPAERRICSIFLCFTFQPRDFKGTEKISAPRGFAACCLCEQFTAAKTILVKAHGRVFFLPTIYVKKNRGWGGGCPSCHATPPSKRISAAGTASLEAIVKDLPSQQIQTVKLQLKALGTIGGFLLTTQEQLTNSDRKRLAHSSTAPAVRAYVGATPPATFT